MTSIGGFAASHLVGQVDTLTNKVSVLEYQNSSLMENKADTERRLQRIEDKLDVFTLKQRIDESAK